MVLVTWARQRTRTPAARAKAQKRRRLHFDRKNALVSRRLNGVGGFAERRVRCPARADNAARPCPCERRGSHSHQIGVGELGRRSIVIGRALVAQRAVDHHEIGWGPGRGNLPRRGQAHEQLASARKQFFSDEDDRAAFHFLTDAADQGAYVAHFTTRQSFGDPITRKSTIDRWCLDLTADPIKG